MTATVTYATVNGMLVMENRGGVKTEYISDTLGNLIQCRDASGNKTYEAWYWSYGEIREQTGTNPSPWGFVGTLGYYTDALNYLYVRARYYRPNLTRWQTVDPLWPSEKPYVYARNIPVLLVDPSGLDNWFTRACKKIVGVFFPQYAPPDMPKPGRNSGPENLCEAICNGLICQLKGWPQTVCVKACIKAASCDNLNPGLPIINVVIGACRKGSKDFASCMACCPGACSKAYPTGTSLWATCLNRCENSKKGCCSCDPSDPDDCIS